MDRVIRWNMSLHQWALGKLNCHLVPLLLINDWVSLDMDCEPLLPLAEKNMMHGHMMMKNNEELDLDIYI